MSKRNLIIEEGSVEAMARLQKQDEEFMHEPSCLELYAAGLIMPLSGLLGVRTVRSSKIRSQFPNWGHCVDSVAL